MRPRIVLKTKFCLLLFASTLMAGVRPAFAGASAPGVHFFRVAGPAASTIIALRADGTLVWSTPLPGGAFTIQWCSALGAGSQWTTYLQIPSAKSLNTNRLPCLNTTAGMAPVPGGGFTMGDTLDGEPDAVPTSTTVTGFYMDTNLVSFGQWLSVCYYATNNGYSFNNPGATKAANHPVQTVDWYDCVKWCNARSQQAGLTPVYYTDAAWTQIYTNGETDGVYPNWNANGYRLPTEAEWEKAARGGVSGQRFPWGNTIDWNHANYASFWIGTPPVPVYLYDLAPQMGYDPAFNDGVVPYTSPVGSFPANGYGLRDMAGNVQEWCWDWYGAPYAGGTDPRGPASGTKRVLRGGLWFQYASLCRCPNRSNVAPVNRDNGTGLRCVKGL
jgi:formylglycine-generating enzyme required for sulfatase activity